MIKIHYEAEYQRAYDRWLRSISEELSKDQKFTPFEHFSAGRTSGWNEGRRSLAEEVLEDLAVAHDVLNTAKIAPLIEKYRALAEEKP